MERREAIKTLGFGSAALFTSSVLFGALQSCSPQPTVNWVPVFLSSEEAAQLEKICEGICPKTTTPGAIEAGVANHLDQAFALIKNDREASFFRKGMEVFVKQWNVNQEVSFNEATPQQVTVVINGYFKKYDESPQILKDYRATFNEVGEKSEQFLETHFVTQIVDATFQSYFTSELVGEQVMRYDPIPVQYQGCIPYQPGQRSWSSV